MASGRHTSLTIQLTATERRTLQGWQRSKTISARRARRGRMLLLLAAQVPVSHIATTVGCTRPYIYKWAQRFLAEGLAGLADKPRSPAYTATQRVRRQGRDVVPRSAC
jgi:helix-turn-helix protein